MSAPLLPGFAVPAPKTAPAVAFRFTVPGQPVSKGRPHVFTQKLKSGKTFTKAVTPERTVVYENWVRECARKAMSESQFTFPLDCPLALRATFHLERPGKPRWLAPASRPDLDNLLKDILDGAQLAGVYVDDARIVRFEVEKLWTTDEPRAEVELSEARA